MYYKRIGRIGIGNDHPLFQPERAKVVVFVGESYEKRNIEARR